MTYVIIIVTSYKVYHTQTVSCLTYLLMYRFLTTVERHLKNVTYGIGFQVVIETIPPMMNALRMVWIVSKHYNTDEKVNSGLKACMQAPLALKLLPDPNLRSWGAISTDMDRLVLILH